MNLRKSIKLYIDRSISSARLLQVSWLLGLLFLLFGVFYAVNELLLDEQAKIRKPSRIVELLVDPGVFASMPADDGGGAGEDHRPRVFEFIITIFGAVIFTGLTISIISNMLEARVSAFKAGRVRYRFSGHILILGANQMLANMIRALADDDATRRKDIVVLTSSSVEELSARLYSELDSRCRRNVTLLLGSRDSEEELLSVGLPRAERVYIVGEDDEEWHDALNVECLEKIGRLCRKLPASPECFMVINNLSTYHVFKYIPGAERKSTPEETGRTAVSRPPLPSPAPLRLTVINSLENWAQQVLVSRRYGDLVYPALDHGVRIGPSSDCRVHFVVVGMTQMAQAMATTAAHISHYPNFREGDGRTRTRITFIAPDIRQEMDFFKGHYRPLFDLSLSRYVGWNAEGEMVCREEAPRADYGDFLDVEWEFVDGGIETEEVRALIGSWCACADCELLTMAVCGNNSAANIAAALYLPDTVFEHGIPVFVYQNSTGKIVEQAHKTSRYSNIYPFGMAHDCYDPSLRLRLLHAKRINYLYHHKDNFEGMPGERELDTLWYRLRFADRLSNIYAVNSIPTKLRTMGRDGDCAVQEPLSDREVELLSRVEHSRWCVEKLIVGFRAIPAARRDMLSEREALALKKEKFMHACICPYDRLTEATKDYDRLFTRHIFDIIGR